MKTSDGSEYTGTWLNDKRHGEGTMLWASGDKYEGSWQDNMRWGIGKETNAPGSMMKDYDGEWYKD